MIGQDSRIVVRRLKLKRFEVAKSEMVQQSLTNDIAMTTFMYMYLLYNLMFVYAYDGI